MLYRRRELTKLEWRFLRNLQYGQQPSVINRQRTHEMSCTGNHHIRTIHRSPPHRLSRHLGPSRTMFTCQTIYPPDETTQDSLSARGFACHDPLELDLFVQGSEELKCLFRRPIFCKRHCFLHSKNIQYMRD